MKAFVPLAMALTLAACSVKEQAPAAEAAMAARDAAGAAGPPPASLDAQLVKPPASEGAAPIPAGVALLAYSYDYAIESPPGRVRGLMAAHEKACAAAGAAICQVTSANVSEQGKDRVSASLKLRATPAWLTKFRGGLADQAKDAGGRVLRESVESEDLSRQIVDTEAQLRAKTTLRDRLQAILETRPGKLSDLVETETELARVQGEIDTTQSELAMMRQRVATSDVEIEYVSQGVLAPQGVFAPLAGAFGDFLGIVVGTLAVMVRTIAYLAPWALLIGVVWWLLRKRMPKLRWPFGRKPAAPPPA